jgi:hypothetical protein
MATERRHYSRYKIRCEAEVICDAGRIDGTVIEISVEGARLKMPKAPTPGTGITVNMNLNAPVMLRGTILWTLEYMPKGIPVFQVGFDTDHLTVDGKEAMGFGERTHFIQEIVMDLKQRE